MSLYNNLMIKFLAARWPKSLERQRRAMAAGHSFHTVELYDNSIIINSRMVTSRPPVCCVTGRWTLVTVLYCTVSMTGRVYCRARWVSGGQIQDMVTPRGHRATPLMTPRNLDAMRCARNK